MRPVHAGVRRSLYLALEAAFRSVQNVPRVGLRLKLDCTIVDCHFGARNRGFWTCEILRGRHGHICADLALSRCANMFVFCASNGGLVSTGLVLNGRNFKALINLSHWPWGGQIGYNWQALGSPLVLGLEADIQGTSLKSTTDLGGGFSGEAKVPAFGTVRGRIGYAWDRFMVYGTGGWAYSKTEATITGPGGSLSDNKWASGYALGGGLEWAFAGPWSLKAEYLYVKAKSVDLTLGGTTFSTGDYHYNVVRAGLNYRF